ncbi:type II/IV secretion system protein [Candidatus Peregrinibacteria bacterium]|nr:type II/IV secretion system protein [Candidatus Peregrinibacteria bacterium]
MPTSEKLQQLQEAILAGNVPQIVLATISAALEMRSSDIHIEPERATTRIRFRIDGVLRRIVEYPLPMHPAVVSRIKIMSNLKIDEQRIPQDGRTNVTTKDNREMDLRVSSLPTVNGEKIVMRLQDKSRKIPTLEELGLEGNSMKALKKGLDAPNGIMMTTGPTGSGKTTTLYACLNILNTADVNILTIEDPVEIQMEGLNQSQVHPDINYTFASGLRTALRQDPDIIMVGEIRDRETMDVAVESSLTGHLVLSTIHTNSAVETLTRISNMGVPSFLMAATINLIIAQRLVRRICAQCKAEQPVSPDILSRVQRALKNLHPDEAAGMPPGLLQNLKFYAGKGCDICGTSGYMGRVGIYEVMYMNNRLRRLIIDHVSGMEIEKASMESGMVNLEQAGILKALKGETTLDEVYSVAREAESEESMEKIHESNQAVNGNGNGASAQVASAPPQAPVSAAPAPAAITQAPVIQTPSGPMIAAYLPVFPIQPSKN